MDRAKVLNMMYFMAWSNHVTNVDGWDDPFWLFNLFPAPCALTEAHCDLIYETQYLCGNLNCDVIRSALRILYTPLHHRYC